MIVVLLCSGTLHRAECASTRGRAVQRRFSVEDDQVEGFVRAKRMYPCGTCWPGMHWAVANASR